MTKRAMPVSLRMTMETGLEWRGIDEVNALIEDGGHVVGIEAGSALFDKVGEADEKVTIRFKGYELVIFIEILDAED